MIQAMRNAGGAAAEKMLARLAAADGSGNRSVSSGTLSAGSSEVIIAQGGEAHRFHLAARIEPLEKQNRELEKALASECISEKEPEVATRLKVVESQLDTIKGPAVKLGEALEGAEVKGNLTAVIQKAGAGGTASGAFESRTSYRGDIDVSLPARSLGDAEGKFFMYVRFGQGTGVGPLLRMPNYTSMPNTTAFQTADGAIKLSPGVQWIDNPSGDSSAATVKIAGVRARLGL